MKIDVALVKEKIALGDELDIAERCFVLDCIDEATAPAVVKESIAEPVATRSVPDA